jgi:pyrroline-5-carboxylate reductase
MTIGFIGTGNIASALVRGLCTADRPPPGILVSPRNAEKASRLAAEFARVQVAESNQAVVDGSDCVVLAVLPKAAEEVLRALTFRSEQRIVSLVALTPVARVRDLVHPAKIVVRAVPLPSAARRLGPIALYPTDAEVIRVLEGVGTPVPAANERDLHVLWALTALIAPYFALLEEICGWAVAAGVESSTARTYLASMFHALSVLAMEDGGVGFGELRVEATTPGGLNEQALREIRDLGGHRSFLNALDSILVRLDESAPGTGR